MDYLFRKLALLYLDEEERSALGIFSTDERLQPSLPGVEAAMMETRTGSDVRPSRHPDAPLCMQCGDRMMRAGSCFACPSCGTTSGCS
jgi:ribonucleoside-diphosphate reductase alpha chain